MKKLILTAMLTGFAVMTVSAQNAENGQRRPRFQYDQQHPDVHDPVIARENGKYYIFATGMNVGCMSSTDMKNWQMEKNVLPETPGWAMEAIRGYRGHTWAPDISYHDGFWRLYYSCSAFGKNTSVIGLAINKTLDPSSPEYQWIDKGKVVQSVPGTDNWNAIDPNLIVDSKGTPWLTWGSFWDGIQIAKLDKNYQTLKSKPKTIARRFYRRAPSDEARKLAQEAPDAGANAIEAPFIIYNDGYYYLFVSWDFCCKGERSNYKTVVGRSKKVNGPYVDSKGVKMEEGGGDILMQRDSVYYGMGHCAACQFDGQWYMVAHGYARAYNGGSKLLIKKMDFVNGWPVMGEDVVASPLPTDKLKGKTINVIGDSYVANHRRPKEESWHWKVAQAHGMTYNNYGRNGCCVAFDRTNDKFGKALKDRYVQMSDSADIILIIAGHNDAGMVKNNADSLAMFRDSLDYLLTNLQEKYPQAGIGYVTPWYVDRPGFEGVVRTIKEVCRRHWIPVLDNYSSDCVIKVRDAEFRKKYFQGENDTAHLNAAGHDLFMHVGENFLSRLIR